MSVKAWISVGTTALMVIVLFLSRHELEQAWRLLSQVDLRILALIIPVQFLSYYASGAAIFAYLKQKGDLKAGRLEMAKMALELNFVNHILPSGGVSGATYMTWRLGKMGISGGRATMAQVVKFATTFAAFVVLLIVALISITLDGTINRFTILVTSGLVSAILFTTLVVVYIISSRSRLVTFSRRLSKIVNGWWRRVFRRKADLLAADVVEKFFDDLHDDYLILRREPRLLLAPLGWGFFFNIMEISMFSIAFWALGTPINPAALVIGYGVASLAGFFMVTPGGAGGYEVLMIGFLVSAGIDRGAAVAAILLSRTILVIGTVASGYIFYQLALNKYGRKDLEKELKAATDE